MRKKTLEKEVSPKILACNSQILVIDKPSGMVVNRAETVKEVTVQDWMEEKLKIKDEAEFYRRSGIVHRLDKETSGVMVIAKTLEAFENLKSQFIARQVEKKYLALVHGKMEAAEGEIHLPVQRTSWDRQKFGIVPSGKKARTKYKLISVYFRPRPKVNSQRSLFSPAAKSWYGTQSSVFSFLEIEPETGRTHQIRVHLKHLGHPLVGDLKYGGRRAKKDRQYCPRLFLHASSLTFTDPQTGKRRTFESPLPIDLRKILSSLKKVE